jgi:hypothetical protein
MLPSIESAQKHEMEIVHAGKMEWGENLVPHRQGHMAHKRIFDGVENSPDNFSLVLARESADYYSPPHRHNFDQVRFCLEGSVPIGKSLRVDAGEVAYFPEGVVYGPQEGGPDRLVLVLQFGGASGQGYMSVEQTRRGRQELMSLGHFEQGVFHRETSAGRKSQDAYAAIWQQVFGRPAEYAAPRYKTPIVMRPEGFAWRDVQGAPGVRRKVLGIFPERGLSLDFIAMDSQAAFAAAASTDRRLLFVSGGEGACGGQRYYTQSAVRLEPNEQTIFTAERPTEMLVIGMRVVGGYS